MSRRRGEFEHRTSIFEGAYRAWSHLGGLELKDLETKPASELDPFVFPLVNDPRLTASSTSKDGVGASSKKNDDNAEGNIGAGEEGGEGCAQQRPGTADGGGSGGSARPSSSSPPQQAQREYPYEPLPRTGLAHPFVQAILSPWLGPDADQDAILLGLTSLRTWWQHRRKGESGSAIIALGTESMRGVVDGYTRHFFHLAHCLVVNDKEPPPRTLQTKMKDLDKSKVTKGKKRSREDGLKAADMAFQSGFGPNVPPQVPQQQQQQWEGMTPMGGDTTGNSLSTVEQLFALQRQQLDQSGGVNNFGGMGMMGAIPNPALSNNPADIKGNSGGSADLPILVQQVSNAATQLAHRGIQSSNYGMQRPSKLNDDLDPLKYGDPSIAPIVVVSPNSTSGMNDIQLYIFIDGITCAHCIKIIETVLKGCPGSRSPIDGLLDAAADMELKAAIIKIDNIADSRRIAYEAAQNLSMVGYVAKARSFNLPNDISLQRFYAVTEGCTPSFAPMMSFQWNSECACPGNNVTRQDCPRHSQMGSWIIEAFDKAEQLLSELVAGCTRRTGQPCVAGTRCFCQSSSSVVAADDKQVKSQNNMQTVYQDSNPMHGFASYQQPIQDSVPSGGVDGNMNANSGMPTRRERTRPSFRMSIGGLGGLGRHFSMASETTFGRAMSGLSALSIDWDNMDDFDVNVDHSEGINNDIIQRQQQPQTNQGQMARGRQEDELHDSGGSQLNRAGLHSLGGQGVVRRSSLRKSAVLANGGTAHVSFS